MKLNVNALANAAMVSAAIFWVVCSLLVVLVPSMMMTMTGHMLHLDMQAHSWLLTGYGFVIGLIIWTALAWVIGWMIGTFYNRFEDKA